MNKKIRKKNYLIPLSIIVCFIIFSLLMSSCSAPAANVGTAKFKFASPAPETSSMSVPQLYFQKRVTELSGGNITFENFFGGSVLQVPNLLEGVQNRTVDMVMGVADFFVGKIPLANFESFFPFGPSDALIVVKAKRQIYDTVPAINENLAQYNTKLLFHQAVSDTDLLSTVPINSLQDMQGKKIGIVAAMTEVIKGSGGVPVVMPQADRYVSLQRGTIEAELGGIDFMGDTKDYDVCKYYNDVDLGCRASLALWMNLDAWNSLSSEQKKIFEQAAKETEEWWPAEQNKMLDGVRNTYKENGVTFSKMADADKVKWANAMVDAPANWAKDMDAKGLPGTEILNSYIKLTEQAGHKWPRKWGSQ